MFWITAYFVFSTLFAAFMLWTITTPNEGCQCGQCNEHVPVFQERLSQLSFSQTILFCVLLAGFALPLTICSWACDLIWPDSSA